ncbi:MAG: pilus assembly protein TadG-related protein [Pseudomonadota bacterium]|nr:pilus assembly protein TadG-related protein [Pseudomonadota bacterium]
MMRQLFGHGGDKRGAVAATVGLSLFALVAAGGIAFDYARMATLDTELQNAADQAALAAATQLDGLPNSRARARAAASQLVANLSLFANDGSGTSLSVATVAFCSDYNDDLANNPTDPPTAPTGCTLATTDANAKVAVVTMSSRRADFALTPVVGAFNSGNLSAQAAANMGSSICKVPPVMICNPTEPTGNDNLLFDYNPPRGVGLRLVTGSATAPGNFGWLEAGLGNGTQALAGALGYNTPPGDCQPSSGVTTKTGMDAAVLTAFNTRFDVYANGNTTCPQQGGGSCNPSVNTRKDLTCTPHNNGTRCANNAAWTPVTYDPPFVDGVAVPLKTAGTTEPDPPIMGYPHDLCHSGRQSQHTCSIQGSGVWDVDAYFRVNYGHTTSTQWRTMLGLTATDPKPTRYEVYKWEIAHPNGTGTKGINFSQPAGANKAFSIPATNNGSGIDESSTQPDRRTIAVAVLNCRALVVKGKTEDVPVVSWLKVFLVEPAVNRGSGSDLYSDQKDIYVEVIEKAAASANNFDDVVRRDVPMLIK